MLRETIFPGCAGLRAPEKVMLQPSVRLVADRFNETVLSCRGVHDASARAMIAPMRARLSAYLRHVSSIRLIRR